MKKYSLLSVLYVFLFLCTALAKSQAGFQLPDGKKRLKIPFEVVNNLIVIPVEVNNVPLSFVLDTGVSSTILFTAKADSLSLRDTKLLSIKGLGQNDSIQAIQSKNNLFTIDRIKDTNHTMYVILESQWDISNRMGVPIHGILGYSFFSKFVVKINYANGNLTIYDPNNYKERKCRKCVDVSLLFSKRKPYVQDFSITNLKENPLLLLDTGASDALWLFNEEALIKENPPNYFEDYLGFAIGGDIFGKRSKVSNVSIGEYTLHNVNVAVPSFTDEKRSYFIDDRGGSIGSGLLSRFHVIIDYPNKKMSLKPNGKFKSPFYYNMSGLTLEQGGVSIVKELIPRQVKDGYGNKSNTSKNNSVSFSLNYTYKLSPKISVGKVQENSPAAQADIRKGDEIISVNGQPAYEYKLHEIVSLFSKKANKKIHLKIKRGDVIYSKRFRLTPML